MVPTIACQFSKVTAHAAGAIGIIQLTGDVESVLRDLSGVESWPVGTMRWTPIADIDDGVLVRLREDIAQVMPHGGPRVMQRVMEHLRSIGAEHVRELPVESVYPEAGDVIEAAMLRALARAESPLAIDLLLAQPKLWRGSTAITPEDRERSKRLNRLITPARVVLAGPANVGKSTLSNALIGRELSIELDQPGTTRDYTAGRIDLAGVVVDWHDTPGLRDSDDAIEQHAIKTAKRLMQSADMLIAITDADHDWPVLPREADLRIANKADLERRTDADVCISATRHEGLAELVRMIRDRLIPRADLESDRPWLFDAALESNQMPTVE